jgi:hypothetical protein
VAVIGLWQLLVQQRIIQNGLNEKIIVVDSFTN